MDSLSTLHSWQAVDTGLVSSGWAGIHLLTLENAIHTLSIDMLKNECIFIIAELWLIQSVRQFRRKSGDVVWNGVVNQNTIC